MDLINWEDACYFFYFFRPPGTYLDPPSFINIGSFQSMEPLFLFMNIAYTQLKHERIYFVWAYPPSFLSFEWSMYRCLTIYEISSWTLGALQCLHLKAEKKIFFCSKENFSFLLVNLLWQSSLYASNLPCVLVSCTLFLTFFKIRTPFGPAPFIEIQKISQLLSNS